MKNNLNDEKIPVKNIIYEPGTLYHDFREPPTIIITPSKQKQDNK